MKLFKRTISMLLAVLMVLAVLPAIALPEAAGKTGTTVPEAVTVREGTAWSALQTSIYNTSENGTVTLTEDITALSGDTYLLVPAGKSIILDLNGHTLDRGLSAAESGTENGSVIRNEGVLTIRDSSGDNSGMLTGGYAKRGGAVYNAGTLTIEGGSLSQNKAEIEGGAVFNSSGSVLTVSSGVLSYNTSETYGGGAVLNFGTMTLSGGAIYGNTAEYNGGGIWNGNGGTLNLTGGVITNNYAKNKASGVFHREDGTLNMSGSPVVNGNIGMNLYLNSTSVINIAGRLTSDAVIDVEGQNLPRTLTSGFSTYGIPAATFTCLYGGIPLTAENTNGELAAVLDQSITVSTWSELQSAMSNSGNQGKVITLTAGLDGSGKDRLLLDGSGKSVIIDLAGHTVDLKRDSSGSSKHVFEAKNGATLIIIDSVGSGSVMGGWESNGGGIYVNNDSTVKLYGVNVRGNRSGSDGGGIYVWGTLEMYGGEVSGNTAGDDGGGIYAESPSRITLRGVRIANNFSDDFGAGLNVHARDDNSTIENCMITGNRSYWESGGGLVFNESGRMLTLTDVIITDNICDNDGGGVYVQHGGVSLTGEYSIIANNKSYEKGGGICNNGGFYVTGSAVIKGNYSCADGGGVYSNDATVIITGSTITENTSEQSGAGMFIRNGTATITDCRIAANNAEVSGGGIYASENCTLNVIGSILTKNDAANYGGGMRLASGTWNFSNITVAENTAGLTGGGIYTDQGIVVQGTIIVHENHAMSQGDNVYLKSECQIRFADAISTESDIGVTLENGNRVFTSGFAAKQGEDADPDDYFFADEDHAIVKEGSELKLLNSAWALLVELIDNAGDGDTVVLERDYKASSVDSRITIPEDKTVTLDLNGHTVDANKALGGSTFEINGTFTVKDSAGGGNITGGSSAQGGAFRVNLGGTLNIESGSITGNTASQQGGAIYSEGTVYVDGGSISGNTVTGTASGNNGGAVWMGLGSRLSVWNGTFSGNYAGWEGGAICANGETRIYDGEFTDNTAERSGGAMLIAGGITTIEGGVFTGNKANAYHGGAVCLSDAELYLYGGTFTGNSAAMEGGAILFGENAAMRIGWYPVVRDNSAPVGRGIYLRGQNVLEVHEQLSGSALLDVSAQVVGRKLTSGLYGRGERSNFTYNGNPDLLDIQDGELYIRQVSAAVYVDSWDALQAAMNNTANDGQIIALTGHLDGTGKDRLLLNGSDRNITIDLAGYSVNLNRTSGGDTKHVFEAKGGATLTIRDSYGTGVITGGWANNGGGIYVNDDSTVILIGVTVMGNKAGSDGGGIYVRGTLEMQGGEVLDNYAEDDGGGIYVHENGKITLYGAAISQNNAEHFGGGFNIHARDNSSTIECCTIMGNRSYWESGGGLVFNQSGKTITLTNNTITGNICDNDGGGIYVQHGGVIITGEDSLIASNKAYEKGGGIYNNGGLTIEAGTIRENSSGNDGGGIYSNNAWMTVNGGLITENTAVKNGGGLSVLKGTTTINGGEIKNNTANESGGGIFFKDNGDLYLNGGTITGNEAGDLGGGVLVYNNIGSICVSGGLGVYDNFGKLGNDVYLTGGKKLTVNGAFTSSANIGVATSYDDPGTAFTSGYSANNPGQDPAKFFFSNYGYYVALKDGEAILKIAADDGTQFIPRNQQIETNAKRLSAMNWMSGVSGERYLNEINMPGSHDSGMNNVQDLGPHSLLGADYTSAVAFFFPDIARKFAKTQREYIFRQFEEGARQVDLRLNDRHKTDHVFGFYWSDDNTNLWICHGKTKKGGTYFAQNSDDEDLSFDQVLIWAKEFLAKHPTETIILDIRPETTEESHKGAIYSRARTIIERSLLEINPATNAPYLYKEPGSDSYFAPYTHMPQLKDCRGKIVLMPDNDEFVALVGGFTLKTFSSTLDTWDDLDYTQTADQMVNQATVEYTSKNGDGHLKLPSNGAERCDYLWYWELNCTGQNQGDIENYTTGDPPYEMADDVNPNLVGAGKLFGPEINGQYIGWVRMDSFEAKYAEIIWRTNFSDALQYCTITVNSGLNAADYPVQTYKVLKGTVITIPGNIYGTDTGRYLGGWNVEGTDTICSQGETYQVNSDVTFTAQWLEEGEIPVAAVWKDADNVDFLRPASLALSVLTSDGTEEVTLTDAHNWHGILNVDGDITGVVPDWSLIVPTSDHPLGQDTTGQYRYELTFTAGVGYVLTLCHTPQTQISVNGSVEWIDGDDIDGLRPASVMIRLYANGSETERFVNASAADDWNFTFINLPEYGNGERIEYTIVIDEIEGYDTVIDGFDVINTHAISDENLVNVLGIVDWNDADDARGQRPESVTVRLLNDGEEVSVQEISAIETGGLWGFIFTLPVSSVRNYAVTIDEIPGYTSAVEDLTCCDGDADPAAYVFRITYTLIVDESEKTPAELIEAPTALELTYNGEEQALVAAGSATGGKLMYALGTDENSAPESGYGEALPVGTQAGTYYVWYYVKADVLHWDTEPQCLLVTIGEAEIEPTLLGDVNLDGEVDVIDALLAMRYAMSIISLNGQQLANGDMSGDGIVDSTDAILIMRAVLEL